jgi:hypothetical protein
MKLTESYEGHDPYNSADSRRRANELRSEYAANKALVALGRKGLSNGLPMLLRKQAG